MNWVRYKLLIISGGITLVVSGGLVYWILSTRGENAEVNSQIQTLSNKQSTLFAQKPYPSAQNFEQLKAEQAKVVEQRDELKTLIREGQLEPRSIRRLGFGDYVSRELVPGLRAAAKSATKGGENGVILADPDFGLSEYLGGVLPDESTLSELLLELRTKEHLSLLLFDSGISELNLLEVGSGEESTGRRDRRPAALGTLTGFGQPPGAPPGPGAPGAEDPGSKLKREKARLFTFKDYRMEFKVYEDFFWQTLNNILSDPNQLVVTELNVTNSNEAIWPSYLEPVLGRGRRTRSQRPAATRPLRTSDNDFDRMMMEAGLEAEAEEPRELEIRQAGLKERRQNVVGQDLLNVVMVVRVYRMTDETRVTEGGR